MHVDLKYYLPASICKSNIYLVFQIINNDVKSVFEGCQGGDRNLLAWFNLSPLSTFI